MEFNDLGFIGFGWEVVLEMVKLGIVCDLSYVGLKIIEDVINFVFEGKFFCFFYVFLGGFKVYFRNKDDCLIKFFGVKGGFIGLS